MATDCQSSPVSPTEASMVFWVNYGVCLPILVVGMLFNGLITYIMLRRRRDLLVSRLDRIVFALVLILFLWSLIAILRALLQLRMDNADFPTSFVACYTSVFVLLIFGVNLLLGIERHTVISEMSEAESKNTFMSAIALMLFFVMFLVFISIAGPPPTFAVETGSLKTWFTIISPVFFFPFWVSIIVGTSAIYIATYFSSVRKLRATLARRERKNWKIRQVRRTIERKIFLSCIAMCLSLFACYMPIGVVVFILAFSCQDMTPALLTGNILVILDTVIAPALVLVFMGKIKTALTPQFGWFGWFKRDSDHSLESPASSDSSQERPIRVMEAEQDVSVTYMDTEAEEGEESFAK
ncbi:hypothetical protein BC830DRAFT_1116625 [Chytriomyces sp. MP71]|nr:hypothetical protein BC830DRAFT_1116625 [Chytriomyces sp. MP71]